MKVWFFSFRKLRGREIIDLIFLSDFYFKEIMVCCAKNLGENGVGAGAVRLKMELVSTEVFKLFNFFLKSIKMYVDLALGFFESPEH